MDLFRQILIILLNDKLERSLFFTKYMLLFPKEKNVTIMYELADFNFNSFFNLYDN